MAGVWVDNATPWLERVKDQKNELQPRFAFVKALLDQIDVTFEEVATSRLPVCGGSFRRSRPCEGDSRYPSTLWRHGVSFWRQNNNGCTSSIGVSCRTYSNVTTKRSAATSRRRAHVARPDRYGVQRGLKLSFASVFAEYHINSRFSEGDSRYSYTLWWLAGVRCKHGKSFWKRNNDAGTSSIGVNNNNNNIIIIIY